MGDILDKAVERVRAEGKVRPTKTLEQLKKESEGLKNQLQYNKNYENKTKVADVFAKYNINPSTFSYNDLDKWASEHNYVKLLDPHVGFRYEPKTEGGFFGRKLTTKQDEDEFKLLTGFLTDKTFKDVAVEHPVLSSTLTVAAAPVRGVAGVLSTAEEGIKTAVGKEVGEDSVFNKIARNTNTIRDTVDREYASKWFGGKEGALGNYGSLLYNGITSIGDSVANVLATGFLTGGMGVPDTTAVKFASNFTSALMASDSAASNIIRNKERGLSDEKAVILGIASGLTEFATEKWSLEKIFKKPTSALNAVWKSFLAEGSEEGVSEIIGNALDVAIAGKDSEIRKNIENYKKDMSSAEAVTQALTDEFYQTLSAFVVGGLSGIAMDSAYRGGSSLAKRTLGGNTQVAPTEQSPADIIKPQNRVDSFAGEAQQQRSAAEVDRIIKDPALSADFEKKSGISLAGMTNSEKRKTVKEYLDKSETTLDASDAEDSGVRFMFDDEGLDGESRAVMNSVRQNIELISESEKFNVGSDEDISAFDKISDYVLNVFNKQGNIAHNQRIGNVDLGKKGAKSTIFHGFGETKLTAVKAIKDVIEKGDIVSFVENYENSGTDRYIIAAKGKINNKPALIGVVVKSYPNHKTNSKFYLHEAEIIETDSPIMTAPQLSVDTVSEPASKGMQTETELVGSDEPNTIPASTDPDNIIPTHETVVKENSLAEGGNGNYTLSDKVDLSSVSDLLSADDVRITDSIVLSDFLTKRFGIRIKYINDPAGRFCGKYDSGTIFINLAKLGNKSSFEVLAHEFGHAFRVINPEGYRELFVMVKSSTALSHRYDEFRNRVRKTYKGLLDEKYDENKIDDLAFEELLSECFAETFKNPDSLRKITESDPKLYAKMRQVILDLIEKVKNFFAGRKNENIRRIVGDFEAIEKRIVEIVSESQYNESVRDSDKTARYLFANDNFGNPYWVIEDEKDIFKNITNVKDLKKAAYDYILHGEKGEIVNEIIDGKPLEFTRISADEYVYGKRSKELTRNDYREKMRMAPSIIDLIDNATTTYHTPDHKNHMFAKDGFNNYKGRVRIDNVIFNYIVRVGQTGNSNMFYDINLEVESALPSAKARQSYKENDSTSKSRLTHREEFVNSNKEENLQTGRLMPEGGYDEGMAERIDVSSARAERHKKIVHSNETSFALSDIKYMPTEGKTSERQTRYLRWINEISKEMEILENELEEVDVNKKRDIEERIEELKEMKKDLDNALTAINDRRKENKAQKMHRRVSAKEKREAEYNNIKEKTKTNDLAAMPSIKRIVNMRDGYEQTYEDVLAEIEEVKALLRDSASPKFNERYEHLEELKKQADELYDRYNMLDEVRTAKEQLANVDVPRFSRIAEEFTRKRREEKPNLRFPNEEQSIGKQLAKISKGLKNGVASFTDFERFMKQAFGGNYALVKEQIVKPFFESTAQYAFDAREYVREIKEKVGQAGFKAGSKERAAIMWIGEGYRRRIVKDNEGNYIWKRENYTTKKLIEEFGKEKAEVIIKTSRLFRNIYDELIERMNAKLEEMFPGQPDKLIKKRNDYFRHFQEHLSGVRVLRNVMEHKTLAPSGVAGMELFTQPNMKFNTLGFKREGFMSAEDAVEGFCEYVQDALYVIHVDEHIHRLRGLARDIAEVAGERTERDGVAYQTISYLLRFADRLAGKTHPLDRAFGLGRRTRAAINALNGWAKAAAIAGNIRSAMTQPTNILNGLLLLEDDRDIARGVKDAFLGWRGNKEINDLYEESGFLSQRYLGEEFDRLLKNGREPMGVFFNLMDKMGTKTVWNAFYHEALRKKETDPIYYADEKTRAAVAGRGIGEVPDAFTSTIGKAFLPYRVEINNNWKVLGDMFGSKKNIWFKTWKTVEYLTLSALLNWGFVALTGSKVTMDILGAVISGLAQGKEEAEEEEREIGETIRLGLKRAAQNVGGEMVSNSPLGQTIIGGMGIDGDTTDTIFNSSLYNPGGMGVPIGNVATGLITNLARGNVIKAGTDTVLSMVPYGNQIKKTAKGIGELARGGAYEKDVLSGKAKGNLKYLVEPSAGNIAKEVLFGPSSLGKSEKYYDGKLPKLNERETALIDENESFDERKAEYEKIAEGKKVSKEKEQKKENKKKRKVTEYIKNAKADDPGYVLYTKGFKDALPICVVPDSIEWTKNKKEYSKTLTSAEQTRWQKELDALVRSNYNKAIGSTEFKNAKLDEKEKLIKSAVSDALSTIKEKIKSAG